MLAADLTLPKLRKRWPTTSAGPATSTGPTRRTRTGTPLTDDERRTIWESAAKTAADATETIRSCAFTDPAAAADAAWAASDMLRMAASVLGSPTLRRAADGYDRAARYTYGRIPYPTPTGYRLRATSRLLALAASSAAPNDAAVMMLIVNLARLVATVAELREAQRHAAQATAARNAAERLRAATLTTPSRVPPGEYVRSADQARRPAGNGRRAKTAADLAGLDNPHGFQPPGMTPSSQPQEATHAPSKSQQPTTKISRIQSIRRPDRRLAPDSGDMDA